MIEITIWIKFPGDPASRYGILEVDEALLDLSKLPAEKFILQKLEPFVEAMLQLDPKDA